MKKCKDCDLIGCLRRGDGETECFYDIDLQRGKEAEEKAYWQSFRNQAAKDILCALLSNPNETQKGDMFQISHAMFLVDELIKQLKDKGGEMITTTIPNEVELTINKI